MTRVDLGQGLWVRGSGAPYSRGRGQHLRDRFDHQAVQCGYAHEAPNAGKLSLDDPIEKYLPEFRIRSGFSDARPPTFRQVVSHVSGLRGSTDLTWASPATFSSIGCGVLAGIKTRRCSTCLHRISLLPTWGSTSSGRPAKDRRRTLHAVHAEERLRPLGDCGNTGWEYTEAMKPPPGNRLYGGEAGQQ